VADGFATQPREEGAAAVVVVVVVVGGEPGGAAGARLRAAGDGTDFAAGLERRDARRATLPGGGALAPKLVSLFARVLRLGGGGAIIALLWG
jgi:hypothetical protein